MANGNIVLMCVCYPYLNYLKKKFLIWEVYCPEKDVPLSKKKFRRCFPENFILLKSKFSSEIYREREFSIYNIINWRKSQIGKWHKKNCWKDWTKHFEMITALKHLKKVNMRNATILVLRHKGFVFPCYREKLVLWLMQGFM